MRSLAVPSLHSRLFLSLLTTGLLIALLASALLMYRDHRHERRAAFDRLSAIADLAAHQWSLRLANRPAGMPVSPKLDGLEKFPEIRSASLYEDDLLLAAYGAENARGESPPVAPGQQVTGDMLIVTRAVELTPDRSGLIRLQTAEPPSARPPIALALVGLFFGAVLAADLGHVFWRRFVFRPLVDFSTDLRAAAGGTASSSEIPRPADALLASLADATDQFLRRAKETEAKARAVRAKAEREQACLRFILESMPIGVSSAVLESDGALTRYFNGAQQRITGLSAEQLGQPAAARIVHPDDTARENELRERLRRGEIDRFSLEKRLLRPDGSVVWVVYAYHRQEHTDGTLQEFSTIVDVTEVRRAREQSEREQARLRFILESMPVGVASVILEENGHLTRYFNGAQQRITGLSAEQLNQAAAARIVHPDDAAREAEFRERLRRGEIDRFSLEKRLVRPDGSVIWVVYTYQRQDYADGTLEELSTMVDVTALRRAREQAEREQARLRFILESMPVGVSSVILEENGHLTRYFNGAQQRITGLAVEQLNQPAAAARLVHPDDAAREAEFRERLHRGEIDRFSLEKRLVRSDGSTIWVVYTYQRQDYADGTLEELSTIVDVTELRRVQEEFLRQQARFRFIFESLPVGVDWMLLDDPSTRIVNPAHARISGVASEQAARPDLEIEATHPDDRATQQALEARLLAGEIDHYTLEKRYLRPDGGVSWAEFNLRLHPDPGTGQAQRIGTLVDLNERKRAQDEIERMHRQLIETSRQAGMAEIATGVLHNVGNVLNSLNISCTLVADQIRRSKAGNLAKICALLAPHEHDLAVFLSEDPKGKMIIPYLSALSESIADEQKVAASELENLRGYVDHIKEIVSMQQEYARTSGVTETLAVPDLLEEALRINADSLARHGITVVREYLERPVITVDKHKALQILINLVRNAKHACGDSGRGDKLVTLRVATDENSVRIAVIDNGVGIPAENLTRIFAHGFTTRKGGHGFGLHSGALAARELGGSLVARSDGPGAGATFELTLPLDRPAVA